MTSPKFTTPRNVTRKLDGEAKKTWNERKSERGSTAYVLYVRKV